jgi:hypothetical protein
MFAPSEREMVTLMTSRLPMDTAVIGCTRDTGKELLKEPQTQTPLAMIVDIRVKKRGEESLKKEQS